MDVGKSKIVWSGNNTCHVSQENVIKLWVALYPTNPDSYSILRCSEKDKIQQIWGIVFVVPGST